MKKRSKLWSLLLAGTMCGTMMMPSVVVTTVYADGTYPEAQLRMKSRPIQDELRRGDKFSIMVAFAADNAIEFEQGVSVSVGGSGTGGYQDVVPQTPSASAGEGAEDINITVYVNDITYTGEGDVVTVSIAQAGFTKTIETEIELANAQPTYSASEGLEVSNNLINVVTGQRQQISFSVKNPGDAISEAGTMTFELEDKNGSEGIVIKTKEVSIPEIRKGQQQDFTFTADIDEKVTTGIHKVKVIIADKDGKNPNTQTLQLKVDSDFMPPSIQVAASNTVGFALNQPKDITISLKNVGHVAAKNVKVEVTPNESVIVADGSNVRYINTVASSATETIDMTLQVIDSGRQTIPLELKLTYIDDLGETQTDSQTLYINTETTAFAKELTINEIIEPSGMYAPGDKFGIGFSIFAEDGAENVTVSVKAAADGIVPKSKNLFVIRDIAAGDKESFYVDFIASEEVPSGTYLIEMQAKYDLNNEETVMSQFATVSIDNPDVVGDGDEIKGSPKVIIGNYSSEPRVVKAGQEFELNLGFLNTNKSKSVHNLKANLTVLDEGENNTGNVFTPVNASNTFYIESLAPGEMMMENITLYTLPSAAPKTYEITIEMEYEDAEGNAIGASEKFGIPVEQVTKLEVAEVYVEPVEIGMESYMTARIYNTGKTAISNIKIQTIGEGFTVQDNIAFIGLLEKGGAEVYEPTLTPNTGGMLAGQLLIEYEDVTGTLQTMVHDFEMEVMEGYRPPEEDYFPEENFDPSIGGEGDVEEAKAGIPWAVIGGLVIGMLGAAGVTTLVAKRQRRRQDEMQFYED